MLSSKLASWVWERGQGCGVRVIAFFFSFQGKNERRVGLWGGDEGRSVELEGVSEEIPKAAKSWDLPGVKQWHVQFLLILFILQMLASTVLSINDEIYNYRCQVPSKIEIGRNAGTLYGEQVEDLLKRLDNVENDWNVLVGAPRRWFCSTCMICPGPALKGASQRFLE